MSDAPNKNLAYHYTSGAALLGIVENKCLWFSDVRALNDSKELVHACEMVAAQFREVAQAHREAYRARGLDDAEFKAFVEHFAGRLAPDVSSVRSRLMMSHWPFVFCLPRRADSLAQWRAYGGGEYCIAFDLDRLSDPSVKLLTVEYPKQGEVPRKVEETCNTFFEIHQTHVTPGGGMHPDLRWEGAAEILDRLPPEFFLAHKDPGFAEEEEVRLVLTPRGNDERIRFRPFGRYPRPYVAHNPFGEGGPLSAISGIMCGPGADRELSRVLVETLAMRFGGRRIEPTFSAVPYRTA